MGGNSRAINRETGEVKTFKGMQAFASPVDLKCIISLREEFIYFWNDLFDVFYKKTGKLLIPKGDSSVSNNVCYLGSARHVLGRHAKDASLVLDVLPIMGDVDVAIPEENIEDLWEVLCSLEEVEFDNSTMTYVGQNRKTLRKPSVNAVFEWNGTFIQIDFVAVPFKNGVVDPFVVFAHSSPWDDRKEGIKGVAHKYLLQTIAWSVSYNPNVIVLTDKSPLYPQDKIRVKTVHEPTRSMSFSVDRGVRFRLQRQFDMNGKPVIVNGKEAVKEIPTSQSSYVTDVEEIFKMFFKSNPSGNDMIDFDSFVGLIRICKKRLSKELFHQALDFLVRFKLYGTGQALSRDSMEIDREAKRKICDLITSQTDYVIPQGITEEYYEKYREREIEA